MAQIKTTDIINGQEVSAEVQKVVKSLNELMKQLGSLSVQYQKSTGSSKKLTEAEKESARIAKEEAKAQKDIENAQKSLQRQRQRGLAAMAKEEAKKRELIATSKQEVTTLRSAEQKLKAMKEVYRNMPQGTEAARKSAEQYRLEIQRLDAAVKKGGAEIGEYNRNVGNYPKGMGQATKSIGGFTKGMGQATKSTGGFTKGLAAMAVGITAAIAVVRKLSKYVTDTIMTFAKFDYVQAQVKAISGATAKEMDALRNTAKELGATTEKSAAEVSQLQLNLSKLGFTASEINAATEAIVKLSIATGEDLARSSEIMAGVMNAFSLPAAEAARIADVMAASFSSSALNLEKFQYSMSSVAPVANELGYSIEEITGLMAVLADSNVDAGTASAQVRNILLELNKSGLTLAEGLEMLNGSTDKMNLANDMFGKRAAPIAVILSNNADKADELTKSFENSAGAADKMAAMMADTLEGDMKKAQSSMEALKISIGEGQNDGLRGIIQGFSKAIDALTASGSITDFLDTFKNLLSPIGEALQNIFEIIVGGEGGVNSLKNGLSGINTIIKVLLSPLVLLAKTIVWLTGNIKKLEINFVPLLSALAVYSARVKIITITTKLASAAKAAYAVVTGVLTGKIKLAEKAQKKMNAATKANIYVAMASAAVALGVALYKVYQNSDKVAALQKDINKAYEEATKSIGNQKAELNSLLTTAKNHNLSLTDRKAAIKKINEISPEYLGNITFENLYTTETTTAINDYNKALQNKAKQQALLSITSEKYAKVLELQYEREQLGTGRYAKKKYNDLSREINTLNDEILQVETSFQKLFATETPTNKIDSAIQSVIDKIDELWNEAILGDADALIELNNIMGTSYDKVALSTVGTADAIQAYKQSLIDAPKLLEETNELLEEEKEAIKAATEAYQKHLETIKGINDEYDLMIQFLKSDADIKQAAIDRDKKLFDASLDYYKKVTPEMQKMIDSYSIITVEAEKLNKIGGLNIVNEQDIELIKTATEEAKSYHQTMVDIANSFDVSTLKSQTFFEKMSEAAAKFGEFWEQNGEAITTVIGSIGDAVNQHYENQIGLLETQQEKTDAYWDRQIERYEGDEAAQAQLEQAKAKAAEETQRKIIDEQRKAAIFNKAQALVDIAINTAVGISKALAAANPILATAIGVSGGIQAGIVASQPLPQYKTGLDSAKEDHIGIVGDAGAELVHYPDGSSALFSKPTATFLPKFSIVDTAQETQAKLKSMEFQNNMYKFTANNDKQVKLLSTIARNTGKNGMREQDIFFIKRYAK